jgi:hypothetical protein
MSTKNKILTYPFGSKCNLAHSKTLSLFSSVDLHEKYATDNINNSFLFLSIIELYSEHSYDVKRISLVFRNLQKNNFCIMYNDHKTNIDLFVSKLQEFLKNTKVNLSKIFIILYLPSEVELLKSKLSELGYEKVNVTYKMNWLLWVKHHYTNYDTIKPIYRFSVFVRRFANWRFDLYTQLLENNVLDNCIYSFSDSHPDFPNSNVAKQQMKDIIPKHYIQQQKINNWIQSLPVSFVDDTLVPVSDIIFRKLQMSYFHIVCETHMDYDFNGVTLTEKIYKPVVAGKPFVVVGQKDILKLLREQGFKTFHPIIDESYDDIDDTTMRINRVCEELKKLNDLPIDEFLVKIDSCQHIIRHNLALVDKFRNEGWPLNYKKLNIFG